MKKIFLCCLVFCLLLCSSLSVCQADVCGNIYTFFSSEIMYMVKFVSSNPDLPCTAGIATLYWQDQKWSEAFSVNSNKLITIIDMGTMFLDNDKLYLLESATVVFTSD